MDDFSASLVREKIDFTWDITQEEVPHGLEGVDIAEGVAISRSNRIALTLEARPRKKELVVIRAQSMHTALRMASKVMFSYYKNGVFTGREHPFEWLECWKGIVSGYDKQFNPDLWGAGYINGKAVFKTKNVPLIDIVEQCALLHIDDYDKTLGLAQEAFHRLGHNIEVDHSTKIASVFYDKGDTMRCGIIHRSEDGGDATFNFSARGGEQHNRVVESLRISAAFLEGNNLRYTAKKLQHMIQTGAVHKASPEATHLRRATARLMGVTRVVGYFEDIYDVKYRPEKPDFFRKT